MIVLNPFQRRRYTLRTLLSPEEASRRLLDAMNDYNATARERFLMATAFGERFSAKIEPGTLGSSGSGTFLKHFVVEANGLFRPTRDGAIDLTIGFRRSTSLGQVLIRLGLICIIAMSVAILIAAPRIVPILAVSFGVGIAPLFLLWSLVAFAQGMRQANRDWEVLMRFVSTALASHHTERAQTPHSAIRHSRLLLQEPGCIYPGNTIQREKRRRGKGAWHGRHRGGQCAEQHATGPTGGADRRAEEG